MKKQFTSLSLILLLLLLASCEENNVSLENTGILGCWVKPKMENDSIWTFQKKASLIEGEIGYQFLENDTMIYRWSGWCSTPTLSFFDQKQYYELVDSIIKIYNSYDQQLSESWRIINVDNSALKVVRSYHTILY